MQISDFPTLVPGFDVHVLDFGDGQLKEADRQTIEQSIRDEIQRTAGSAPIDQILELVAGARVAVAYMRVPAKQRRFDILALLARAAPAFK